MEPDVFSALIRPDPTLAETLVQQIYHGVRQAALSGVLPPNMVLPSTRTAALQWQVGRNAVVAAYELLAAEGVIVTGLGKRPRIAAFDGAISKSVAQAAITLSQRARLLGPLTGDCSSLLAPGSPDPSLFPADLWGQALRRAGRHRQDGAEGYSHFTGLPELRQVLAEHLHRHRGLRVEPDEILVTSGTQSSLMICAMALADPGDVALVENPGYRNARRSFAAMGLTCRALAVDEAGALADGFAGAKLAYITPSTQYPTGVRMPIARRLALIQAANASQTVLIEDDYDSEFVWHGRGIAALGALEHGQNVITIGSAAKSLLPGLRIGWIVAPKALAPTLRDIQRNFGVAANVHAQSALAEVMSSGQYRRHLQKISQTYRDRMQVLSTALYQELGDQIVLSKPEGGLQIVAWIKSLVDDHALCQQLAQHGYGVQPLSEYYLNDARPGVLLGFGNMTTRQAQHFASLLREILPQYRAGS